MAAAVRLTSPLLRATLAAMASRRPTLLLCIAGLALPNALAVVAELRSIGLPPRSLPITFYALLAMLAPALPAFLVVPAYLAVLAYDVVSATSAAFYFTQWELVSSLHLGAEIDVLASPLYAALCLGLALLVAANIALLLAGKRLFAGANRPVFAALMLLVSGGDMLINVSPHYDFGPLAARGQPFESAVQKSGFGEALESGSGRGRNVLLVMVESLGVLSDRRQRALLFAPFRDPELLARYSVSSGYTTFFGATAYGEMRELCGTRASYKTILAGNDPVCLPDVLAAKGYRTVSVHGFTDAFYARKQWYPKIGFARSIFQESLTRYYGRSCGGAFSALCDVDIAEAIATRMAPAAHDLDEPSARCRGASPAPCEFDFAEKLKTRMAAEQHRLFVYWLTLNTHVPVRIGDAKPRFGCTHGGGAFGEPEVCTMVELWVDLFEAVRRIALEAAPMEILLVGDHAPPLWRRAARNMFEPGIVPWVRLTPKPGMYESGAKVAQQDQAGSPAR